MRKRRRGRPRAEHLIRTAEIRAFDAHTSIRLDQPKGAEPQRDASNWLMLRGVLQEPVKGYSDVRIRVVETADESLGPNRPAAIGYVFGVNPEVSIYVPVPVKQFDRLWTLAAGGKLTQVWVSMTPPRYGSADILSISFACEPIE